VCQKCLDLSQLPDNLNLTEEDPILCGAIATCGRTITSMVMMERAGGMETAVGKSECFLGGSCFWLVNKKGVPSGTP
jgi:hypothetical protein